MKKKLALFLAAFVALVTYTVRAAIQEAEPEVLFTMNCTGEADVKTDGDVAGDTPTEYSLANYASFGVDNTSAAFYKLAKQGTTTAKYIGKLGSGNVRFCLANGGDKVYFKITLSKAIEVGDVISWDVYPNNADTEKTTGLLFNKEASTTGVGYGEVLTDADVQKKACPQSYTVKKDDNIVGVTELYVTRTGGLGTYFDNLKIIRPAADESQQTPDYYVVGSMNKWTTSDTYKFTANAEAEGEYMFTGDFSKGDEFKVTSSEGAWYPDGQDNNYVIKEDGNYTIYFRPDGKGGDDWYYGCFYVALNEVTPEPAITYPVTAKWDWEAKYEPTTLADVYIEKGTGSVESNVKGIRMFVDATNGKLQTAKDQNFTQFNTGTILQVPVGSTSDVVTVKAHSYNFENIKVGGVVSTDLTTNHTATAEEVAAGYVVIESTASPYLYSVQVTMQDPNATPEPQPTLVGYFVVGSMNEWSYDEAYQMTPNNEQLYQLTKEFKAGDKFKVKSMMSDKSFAWYPDGTDNDFEITQDGEYTITFNPAGNVEGWHGGYFNVVMKEQPIILNDYTVQFINGANWDEVFAYTWTGEGDAKVEQLNPWAGTAMRLTNTFEEIDGIRYPVYELKFQHAIEPANIIFSDGKGGEVGKTQTENLAFENNHKYQLIIKPQLYNVKIAEIENGTVLADPTQAEAGATITLTARPAEGYELDGEIMVTCAHEDKVIPVENGTFMMPADDVTVNATFKKQGGDEPVAETETIEFTAAGTGTNPMVYTEDHFTYTFDKGSGSNNPAYVANAGETRLYAKGSLTIKANAGEKISKIVFDAAINANKNGVAPTIDGVAGTTAEGTWDAENWTWTGEDTEVQMSTSGSAGNVGFKSITVTYTSSGDVPQPVVINSMAINGTFPGMSWDADKGIAMTKSVDNEAVWTLTMENVTVEGQKYEYKAFANGETTGYQLPSAEQGNADFVFGTDKYPAGEYTLTFTANTKSHTLTLDVKKNGINTIKELNAQDNGTEFTFVGDAIVVAKVTKGTSTNYVYIKDETGSSLIFDKTGENTAKIAAGNVITAPWTGKVSIYNNLFEATPTAALGATSTVEVKYPEVTADYVKAENMNQVVLIITIGGAVVPGYNQFGIDLEFEGNTFDVVGAISVFNGNVQFQPITITEAQEPQPAEIDKVQLLGTWNWKPEEGYLTLSKGEGFDWTGTLDLSKVTQDQEFKLVINGKDWIGSKQLTLVDQNNLVTVAEEAGSNFILNNANSGFQTYTITAKWQANANSAEGWTLEIAGKDKRVTNTYTAYFSNTGNWENVYAYAWATIGEGAEANTRVFLGDWPGTLLTNKTETGLYKVEIEDSYAPQFIIFNNGNSGKDNQTKDLAFENGMTYSYEVEPTPEEKEFTVQFVNNRGWKQGSVHAYAWSDHDETHQQQLGDWPGTEMGLVNTEVTYGGEKYPVYELKFKAETAPEFIIFNDGTPGEQDPKIDVNKTEDLVFVNEKQYLVLPMKGELACSVKEPMQLDYSDEVKIYNGMPMIIWGQPSKTETVKFKVGDALHIRIVECPGMRSPGLQLMSDDGKTPITENLAKNLEEVPAIITIPITGAVYEWMKDADRRVRLNGQNVFIDRMTIEADVYPAAETPAEEETTVSVWVPENAEGEQIGQDATVEIPATPFVVVNVKKEEIVKIKASDAVAPSRGLGGAVTALDASDISILKKNSTDLLVADDQIRVSEDGSGYEFTVTDEATVTELKTKGFDIKNRTEKPLVIKAIEVQQILPVEIVYNFAAAAAASENPENLNGSTSNGGVFYGWENEGKTYSFRQDYKGYTNYTGTNLPAECHVWRRGDRINGNITAPDAEVLGLKCPNQKEMAINGLTAGQKVVIEYVGNGEMLYATGYDPANATAEPNTVAIVGDGNKAAISGTTTIASGTPIHIVSTDNGYFVFRVLKNMVITKITISDEATPIDPATVVKPNKVIVAAEIENGTVKVQAQACAGDEVTVTATPAEGYELEAITVKDADENEITVTDGKFIMPAKAVTVSATFKKIVDYYLTGNMTEWGPKADYKLTLNTEAAPGVVEYMITLDLATTDMFKIARSDDGTTIVAGGWYPDGMENNYGEHGEITETANYTVYFRPNADGNADWFYNVIYVVKNGPATGINNIDNDGVQGVRVANPGKGVYIKNGKKVLVK